MNSFPYRPVLFCLNRIGPLELSLISVPTTIYNIGKIVNRIDKEKAMEVATEQYGFCPDVIDQQEDDPTIGNLADVLWQSTVWYFWWD